MDVSKRALLATALGLGVLMVYHAIIQPCWSVAVAPTGDAGAA